MASFGPSAAPKERRSSSGVSGQRTNKRRFRGGGRPAAPKMQISSLCLRVGCRAKGTIQVSTADLDRGTVGTSITFHRNRWDKHHHLNLCTSDAVAMLCRTTKNIGSGAAGKKVRAFFRNWYDLADAYGLTVDDPSNGLTAQAIRAALDELDAATGANSGGSSSDTDSPTPLYNMRVSGDDPIMYLMLELQHKRGLICRFGNAPMGWLATPHTHTHTQICLQWIGQFLRDSTPHAYQLHSLRALALDAGLPHLLDGIGGRQIYNCDTESISGRAADHMMNFFLSRPKIFNEEGCASLGGVGRAGMGSAHSRAPITTFRRGFLGIPRIGALQSRRPPSDDSVLTISDKTCQTLASILGNRQHKFLARNAHKFGGDTPSRRREGLQYATGGTLCMDFTAAGKRTAAFVENMVRLADGAQRGAVIGLRERQQPDGSWGGSVISGSDIADTLANFDADMLAKGHVTVIWCDYEGLVVFLLQLACADGESADHTEWLCREWRRKLWGYGLLTLSFGGDCSGSNVKVWDALEAKAPSDLPLDRTWADFASQDPDVVAPVSIIPDGDQHLGKAEMNHAAHNEKVVGSGSNESFTYTEVLAGVTGAYGHPETGKLMLPAVTDIERCVLHYSDREVKLTDFFAERGGDDAARSFVARVRKYVFPSNLEVVDSQTAAHHNRTISSYALWAEVGMAPMGDYFRNWHMFVTAFKGRDMDGQRLERDEGARIRNESLVLADKELQKMQEFALSLDHCRLMVCRGRFYSPLKVRFSLFPTAQRRASARTTTPYGGSTLVINAARQRTVVGALRRTKFCVALGLDENPRLDSSTWNERQHAHLKREGRKYLDPIGTLQHAAKIRQVGLLCSSMHQGHVATTLRFDRAYNALEDLIRDVEEQERLNAAGVSLEIERTKRRDPKLLPPPAESSSLAAARAAAQQMAATGESIGVSWRQGMRL